MANYKARPEVIRAITVDAILANNANVPPSHSPRIAGLIANGFIVFQPNNKISVTTPKGKVIGEIGMTLLQDLGDDLSLMPTTKFNKWYQPD